MKLNGPSRECLRALWPDSRQQKLAYSIRPFKNLLSQGLVTVATLSGFFFSDCHKAVWWNQLGLLESACGPCDQIVDNRRWLIQSGLLNYCHKALWRRPRYQDFWTIAQQGRVTVAIIGPFQRFSQARVMKTNWPCSECHRALWPEWFCNGICHN